MIKIERIEPVWNQRYANMPNIKVYVEEPLSSLDWLWKPIPALNREKVMLISVNNFPWVRFVYIDDPKGDPRLHGALGGTYHLTNGEIIESRSGWSSRSGIINTKYADFIPGEIADVTIIEPGWKVGLAGYHIYANYLKNHPLFPKNCHLVRTDKWLKDEVYHIISKSPNTIVKEKASV